MYLNEKIHFSFLEGMLSVFFGSRQTRLRRYHQQIKSRSDKDALMSDFKKVGADMRKSLSAASDMKVTR